MNERGKKATLSAIQVFTFNKNLIFKIKLPEITAKLQSNEL